METFANYGIASHGLYKTKVNDDQVKAKLTVSSKTYRYGKRSSSSLEFLENKDRYEGQRGISYFLQMDEYFH